MAKVRVDLDYVIHNGSPVTFNAPCDCTAADGLIVYHPEGYQSFTFCDAHGENLSGIGDVFVAGVPVKVILDTENSRAFVQNGDNNTHLNSMLSSMLDRIGVLEMGAVCESGSYIGTAVYKDYTQSLTFSFVPKFVFVVGGTGKDARYAFIFPSYAVASCPEYTQLSYDFYSLIPQLDGTTLSWYYSGRDNASNYTSDLSINALGYSHYTYHYIAFG